MSPTYIQNIQLAFEIHHLLTIVLNHAKNAHAKPHARHLIIKISHISTELNFPSSPPSVIILSMTLSQLVSFSSVVPKTPFVSLSARNPHDSLYKQASLSASLPKLQRFGGISMVVGISGSPMVYSFMSGGAVIKMPPIWNVEAVTSSIVSRTSTVPDVPLQCDRILGLKVGFPQTR